MANNNLQLPLFLTRKQVIALTSLSRSTLYRLERDSLFPKSFKMSKRRVGYMRDEVLIWLTEKRG
ncbi:helix-turn-helix transcriptional regulator [Alteromonas macleodii]|uniref:helix-turn-helix transcriptional regulator n=1 Tax=Alteromonas macleodii TaxID=28108 RepID=UPI003653B28F